MLHIYTLHFKNDYWVNLQVESFKKHIKVPYKSYAIFSHMNQEMYDRNENKCKFATRYTILLFLEIIIQVVHLNPILGL